MQESNRNLSRIDQLNLLHQTSADTLMGKLLRSFWQPIAISDQLSNGTALPVRIMGEDLTLYRGTSGKPSLVDGRCAHRCTVLHTGWVQGDQIRCMYHGWLYDGTGQCLEMPAEKGGRPESVKIKAYPVRDYFGLVFAFMGDGAAPEFDLPRRDSGAARSPYHCRSAGMGLQLVPADRKFDGLCSHRIRPYLGSGQPLSGGNFDCSSGA